MKFKVNNKTLAAAMDTNVAGRSAVLAILDDFLIELKGNSLTITSTDLKNTVTSRVEVVGIADGASCVPGALFLSTLKQLPEQDVTISADIVCQIDAEQGRYKLPTNSASDFPAYEDVDGNKVDVDWDIFRSSISKVEFATSRDELRQAMTGVYVEFGDVITMVATDGYRLAEVTMPGAGDGAVIISKDTCTLLKGIDSVSATICCSENQKRIRFGFDNITVTGILIGAKFPAYKNVIPEDLPYEVKVNRKELIGSLKRVSLFGNKQTNAVKFAMNGDFKITAADMDFGNEATETIQAQSNAEMQVGYNSRIMQEVLSVMGGEDVTFNLRNPKTAAILKEHNSLYLVMPVVIE